MSQPKKYDDPGFLSKKLGEYIKAELERDDVPSQNAVAHAAGLSVGQMSGLINGKKQFTLGELDRICFALKLKTSAMVRRAEAETRARYVGTPIRALDIKR